MEYVLHILVLIGIYTILSTSLNLIVGYTGLLSIAHAAFFGVGAYVAALMALTWDTPFLVNLVCATIASGMLGGLVGISSLRIRGAYFAIGTFAFQLIAFNIFNNWVTLTGGPMGLPGIPHPSVLGYSFESRLEFLVLLVLIAGSVLWITYRIVCSPFGRVLKAIREDEIFAQTAGKNVAIYKILVFILGAGIAAVAGALYASYVRYIDPTSFTVMESIFIISIVIIGGSGSMWGPVIGSIFLIILPEVLRFLDIPSHTAANARQIIYGILLIAFIVWRPLGLTGEYSFGKRGSPE